MLHKFRDCHAKGIEQSTSSPKSVIKSYKKRLFGSKTTFSRCSGGLVPPPFLVPAVMEALFKSKYSSITFLVPGEADDYCAVTAKRNGATVLSQDSDLLLYDLGSTGAVCFFTNLKLVNETPAPRKQCEVLKAEVLRPDNLAQRLGVSSVGHLAFELQQDYTVSLNEAVRRSKMPLKHLAELEAFLAPYHKEVSTNYALSERNQSELKVPSQYLDLRISEFVLRSLNNLEHNQVIVYLPMLIEDPSKASSWTPSTRIRKLAYRFLEQGKDDMGHELSHNIHEYQRKGVRFVSERVVEQLSQKEVEEAIEILARNLEHTHGLCRRIGCPKSFWRIFALAEVSEWYLKADKKAPLHVNVAQVLYGSRTALRTWLTIHLLAQVESVLYSLRILWQLLKYISGSSATLLPNGKRLFQILESLPPLFHLMDSPGELQEKMSSFSENQMTDVIIEVLLERRRNLGLSTGDIVYEGADIATTGQKKQRRSELKTFKWDDDSEAVFEYEVKR